MEAEVALRLFTPEAVVPFGGLAWRVACPYEPLPHVMFGNRDIRRTSEYPGGHHAIAGLILSHAPWTERETVLLEGKGPEDKILSTAKQCSKDGSRAS